jgi:ribokinase
MPVSTVAEAGACASRLISQGIQCVIITLGAQGCVVADSAGARHHPAHEVKTIDTTGAGDAFVGCMAASLASGNSQDESIRRALIYSALSTTRRGALTSYPTREEFNAASASTSKPRTF